MAPIQNTLRAKTRQKSASHTIRSFVYNQSRSTQKMIRQMFPKQLETLHDYSPKTPSPLGETPSATLAVSVVTGADAPEPPAKRPKPARAQLSHRKYAMHLRHAISVNRQENTRFLLRNSEAAEFDREYPSFKAAMERKAQTQPIPVVRDPGQDLATAVHHDIAMMNAAFAAEEGVFDQLEGRLRQAMDIHVDFSEWLTMDWEDEGNAGVEGDDGDQNEEGGGGGQNEADEGGYSKEVDVPTADS